MDPPSWPQNLQPVDESSWNFEDCRFWTCTWIRIPAQEVHQISCASYLIAAVKKDRADLFVLQHFFFHFFPPLSYIWWRCVSCVSSCCRLCGVMCAEMTRLVHISLMSTCVETISWNPLRTQPTSHHPLYHIITTKIKKSKTKVTLWYRSPELLLGTNYYSTEIDMWSVGCIFAELLTQKALFPAKTEIESLNKIFQMLGTPNERVWEGFNKLPHVEKWTFKEFPKSHWRKNFAFLTEQGFDLLSALLRYDPAKRITASEALEHEWFKEKPLPVTPEDFPHW